MSNWIPILPSSGTLIGLISRAMLKLQKNGTSNLNITIFTSVIPFPDFSPIQNIILKVFLLEQFLLYHQFTGEMAVETLVVWIYASYTATGLRGRSIVKWNWKFHDTKEEDNKLSLFPFLPFTEPPSLPPSLLSPPPSPFPAPAPAPASPPGLDKGELEEVRKMVIEEGSPRSRTDEKDVMSLLGDVDIQSLKVALAKEELFNMKEMDTEHSLVPTTIPIGDRFF